MEVHALAAGVRLTPRKARLVAATVVGLPVNEALTVLKFTPRAAAHEVAKVIKSAVANAEHNYELDVDTLRVARIEVDGARSIKRFRPRAQGRAFSILKRTAHVRAVVTDDGYASLSRNVKANTSPGPDLAPRRRRGTRGAAAATASATPAARGTGKAAAAKAAPAEKPARGRGSARVEAKTDTRTEAKATQERKRGRKVEAAAVADAAAVDEEDVVAVEQPQGEIDEVDGSVEAPEAPEGQPESAEPEAEAEAAAPEAAADDDDDDDNDDKDKKHTKAEAEK
jgi:large subunit ribosomal protein L22